MKYSIGQTVKIKATGEKVKITKVEGDYYVIRNLNGGLHTNVLKNGYIKTTFICSKSELKPYCPSRSGTRDPKTGRFVSEKISFKDWQKGNLNSYLNKTATEVSLDSKQRNYQKIKPIQWTGEFITEDEKNTKVIIDRLNQVIEKVNSI